MAHLPAHLPRSEADLADWSVYADELQREGDPLGDFIAHDLALPAHPSDDELAAYLYAADAWCWKPRELIVASWTLGFIRELEMTFRRYYEAQGRPPSRIDDRMAAPVVELLGTRAGSRLEALHVPTGPMSDSVRRLFDALPPTCTRLVNRRPEPEWLVEMVDALPAHVTELEVNYLEGDAIRVTDKVRVYLQTIEPELLSNPRVELVHDYGFDLVTKRVTTYARVPVFALQRKAGVIPVRTQLVHTPPTSSDGAVLNIDGANQMYCAHDVLARARAM